MSSELPAPGRSNSVLLLDCHKKEGGAFWPWMPSVRLSVLWEKPKTEPCLNEVPVTCQDIRDVQFLRDNHCRQIREGNVRFVAKRKTHVKGSSKPRLSNLFNLDEWRCQQSLYEARRFLERTPAKKQAYRLVQNKIRRKNIP